MQRMQAVNIIAENLHKIDETLDVDSPKELLEDAHAGWCSTQ